MNFIANELFFVVHFMLIIVTNHKKKTTHNDVMSVIHIAMGMPHVYWFFVLFKNLKCISSDH